MLLGGGAWREWVLGKVTSAIVRCTSTGLNLPGRPDGPSTHVATWPFTAHVHLKLVNSFKASSISTPIAACLVFCFSFSFN